MTVYWVHVRRFYTRDAYFEIEATNDLEVHDKVERMNTDTLEWELLEHTDEEILDVKEVTER